ncbi:iron (metal) dependent repressor, DtxR family [Syntrophobotulus glycolicus DSM 8271]|uniref:Manganese transport regulator n=1 Tax=Syntrophobotulus glycolicus (strain DSM 8271 / FlGlyR) TaxID=645991 RepID=F0SX14_SYNGF|nr:iron dependent repressor, metal binding and dimerization domain protein [Syntrophobotulus glycolicus]ADY55797.1 iron (metal) dependent repressor, DtxR family [Syntrophobotulus glycolicus DSM 8271]
MKETPNLGFRTVRGYQLANRREDGLTPALEDYLEMVYRLCSEDGYARVGKLSELLHVKPSSTSKMILKLVNRGYLEYDPYDSICLTGKGQEAGAYLLARHDTTEEFLRLIGNTSPLEEAELIEHSLSTSTVTGIKTLLAFFARNPEINTEYEAFKKTDLPASPSDR